MARDTTIPVWPSSETIKHWESISLKEDNTAFDGIENSPWNNEPYKGPSSSKKPDSGLGGLGGGQILSYPIDLDTSQDYLEIERFKYKRSVKKTNSNQSGPGANDIKGSSLGTIILPMPKVSDSTGAQWGKSELNVFGAALLGAGSNVFNLDRESSPDSNAAGNLDEQLRKLNTITKKNAGNSLKMGEFKGGLIAGGAMVAEKTMNFLGQNVTADQILARSRGQILNPNAELLFSGPVLRQFSFTFLLLARSQPEGREIRKIIRTFKEGAVPKHVNDALLTNPDIWQLTYKRNDRPLNTVNKFGAMGLTTITVDYAPEGFWTAYEDSQPVACRLNLEFGEVRPLYQQDYEGDSDSVGY